MAFFDILSGYFFPNQVVFRLFRAVLTHNERYSDVKPELIVALDVQTEEAVTKALNALPSQVNWYKVGLELFIAAGPSILSVIKKQKKKIFLDLKLHDIPNTVAKAVISASAHGVDLMTVHAGGGREMLRFAAEAATKSSACGPKIVAVTTLTSLNQADLAEMGITRSLSNHTLSLGEMAVKAGIHGLVCSVHEAAEFRSRLGPDPLIVTPGIRPEGADIGDQKRVATPGTAVDAGSSFLVVGRPIMDAKSPGAAAEEIIAQIEAAYAAKQKRAR